jgi:hypothetical protein
MVGLASSLAIIALTTTCSAERGLVLTEEALQGGYALADVLRPGVQPFLAGRCHSVEAFGRARSGGVPPGEQPASFLHLAQSPVDHAGINRCFRETKLVELLQQVIAVGLVAVQEQEQTGLQKAV